MASSTGAGGDNMLRNLARKEQLEELCTCCEAQLHVGPVPFFAHYALVPNEVKRVVNKLIPAAEGGGGRGGRGGGGRGGEGGD